jgi:selenocysteine-specific elongation factor
MSTQLVLGTAGHIDHGKTALVRALTGIDTDRLEEEKRRGISIDIGFAHLDLGGLRLGIVDVPGHERFIRNMLAGASGIDVVLLVVAADDSIMPQTREHLAILELLQVGSGVIALTKADLVEPAWRELVEAEIRELVRGTFLERAPIVPTSVIDGRGLDALRQALADACAAVRPALTADLFRMAVDRSFVRPGLGTVVTGTVSSGAVAAGEEVEWLPGGRRVRVRSIQSHGRPAQRAGRGQRAALNLMGVHHQEVIRGHVLAVPGYLRPSRRLTVHVRVIRDSPWPLRHRAHVRLHAGTQEVMAEARLLQGTEVPPGAVGFVQFMCAEPVVCWGRQPVVVRSESPLRTLGGGAVLCTAGPRLARRDEGVIERLEGLCGEDELERAGSAAYFHGVAPLEPVDLCRELDVPMSEAAALLMRLRDAGGIVELAVGGTRAVHAHVDALQALRGRIEGALRQLHGESPLQARVPRERLLRRLADVDGAVLAAIVARMVGEGGLVGDEVAIGLAEFKPLLTEAQLALRQRMLSSFQAGGFSPPDPLELARAARVPEAQCRSILDLCVQEGSLVHVDGMIYLHGEWDRALRERVGAALRRGEGLTVAQIRDLLGTSRKYAVPLCEHLDRAGVTRRQGDLRVRGAGGEDGG